MYKIEKGIPVPTTTRTTGLTKVILQMEVGDSVATNYHYSVTTLNARYAPKEFRSAKLNREFRIWRVA